MPLASFVKALSGPHCRRDLRVRQTRSVILHLDADEPAFHPCGYPHPRRGEAPTVIEKVAQHLRRILGIDYDEQVRRYHYLCHDGLPTC